MFSNINSNTFIFTSVLVLPIGYVFGRLSLILPATAIDQDNSFSTAWHISKGNGWNLCFLISILPFLTGFVIDSLNSPSIVSTLFSSILSIFILFYEVSILSNSYKTLVIKQNKAQSGAIDSYNSPQNIDAGQ